MTTNRPPPQPAVKLAQPQEATIRTIEHRLLTMQTPAYRRAAARQGVTPERQTAESLLELLSQLLVTDPRAAGRPATGSSPPPTVQPAWIIVELDWEHHDECTYHEFDCPRTQLYLDQQVADAECRRLCEQFFAAQSPQTFAADTFQYGLDGEASWEQLRAAGFPDPFYVLELTP